MFALAVAVEGMLRPKPKTSSPPSVDRIWLRVNSTKIPIYPISYLLKGDPEPDSIYFRGTINPKLRGASTSVELRDESFVG